MSGRRTPGLYGRRGAHSRGLCLPGRDRDTGPLLLVAAGCVAQPLPDPNDCNRPSSPCRLERPLPSSRLGCGLRQLKFWEACAEKLHGVDLLSDRVAAARQFVADIDLRQANGWQLPYADVSMDLVSAHTLFSSILNEDARASVAAEMTRVLDPHGHILIFDFRISHPLNSDTIGIRRSEISRLFPDFQQHAQSLILAPPIARCLAPVAPCLAVVLEGLCPPLRTHNMSLLRSRRLGIKGEHSSRRHGHGGK